MIHSRSDKKNIISQIKWIKKSVGIYRHFLLQVRVLAPSFAVAFIVCESVVLHTSFCVYAVCDVISNTQNVKNKRDLSLHHKETKKEENEKEEELLLWFFFWWFQAVSPLINFIVARCCYCLINFTYAQCILQTIVLQCFTFSST